MKLTIERLEHIKNNGFSLDFGEVFNEAFENYKKTALIVGVIMLLFMIIFGILGFGFVGVLAGVGSYTEFLTNLKPSPNTSTTMLIIGFFSKITVAGCIAPLTAGILKINYNASINEEVSIGTAFEFYQSKSFKNLFIAAVFIATFLYAVELAANFIWMKDLTNINSENIYAMAGSTMLATVFNIIAIIFVTISTVLVIPLIIFGNLSPIDAIKNSFLLIFKKFWIVFALLFVAVILSFIGFIAICIGVLFTIPFYYSTVFAIYKNSVGIENISEIDQIGNSEF